MVGLLPVFDIKKPLAAFNARLRIPQTVAIAAHNIEGDELEPDALKKAFDHHHLSGQWPDSLAQSEVVEGKRQVTLLIKVDWPADDAKSVCEFKHSQPRLQLLTICLPPLSPAGAHLCSHFACMRSLFLISHAAVNRTCREAAKKFLAMSWRLCVPYPVRTRGACACIYKPFSCLASKCASVPVAVWWAILDHGRCLTRLLPLV